MIRPACLSDVKSLCEAFIAQSPLHAQHHRHFECVLQELYDAEWRKRGFEKSP